MNRRNGLRAIANIAFITLLFQFSQAQQSRPVDSLLAQLEGANDSTRWELYAQLSLAYNPISADSAILFGESAFELADALQRDTLLFKSNNLIGIAYVRKGEFDQTLAYFLKSLRLAEQHEGEQWRRYEAQACINVGGVFWARKEAERALPYAHRARSILELLDEPNTLADNYQSLGMMHHGNESLDSARIYFEKALPIYRQIGDKLKEGRILGLIGDLYFSQGLYEKALQQYDLSLQMAETSQDAFEIANHITDIGNAYLQLGQLTAAARALHKSLSLSNSEGFAPNRRRIFESLATLHARQNRFDSAYHYQQLLTPMLEASYDTERAKQINELETKYKTEQKTLENKVLQQQNTSIQNRNKYTTIIAILLLIIVIFGSLSYRNQQRKKAIITQQNKEMRELANALANSNGKLSSMLDERSHLVSLLTHDMQTPLSTIKFTTASLIQENTTNDWEKELIAIDDATVQVTHLCNRIIETHQLEDLDLQLQLQPVQVNQAIREALLPYTQWAKRKGLNLIYTPENQDFSIHADPLLFAKAFGNILSNAIKFSNPGQTIRIRVAANGRYGLIAIQDQGPGMPPEDQQKAFRKNQKLSARPTAGESGTGNGLYLAKYYIEAMQGKIELESESGAGCLFTIKIPLQN